MGITAISPDFDETDEEIVRVFEEGADFARSE
jgi:hypothetical protein